MRERKDEWAMKGYPPVQFITYAYDDPDAAPVLDVSATMEQARRDMAGRTGFMYRVERLPVEQWENPQMPCYGNETFVMESR